MRGKAKSPAKQPDAFRLVDFKTGSGIAVLEPPLVEDEQGPERLAEVPTLAWDNLADLLEAV